MNTPWGRCSSCKGPIAHGARYYTCSVSTCNRTRMQLTFCSLRCWDAHVPSMGHSSGVWANEQIAPSPDRRVVRPPGTERQSATPREVLIVASRLKDYVKAKADMNTADQV